jgi:hypothetical protein
MIVPGFEPKKMSDEEIQKKITALQSKLYYAYAMNSQGLQNQLQLYLEALQVEQQERLAIRVYEMQEKQSPKVIETEPDLQEKKVMADSPKKKIANSGSKFASFFPPKSKTPSDMPADKVDIGVKIAEPKQTAILQRTSKENIENVEKSDYAKPSKVELKKEPTAPLPSVEAPKKEKKERTTSKEKTHNEDKQIPTFTRTKKRGGGRPKKNKEEK